jgi:hypothetical protein
MTRVLRDNGLSIALAALFLGCWLVQTLTGWAVFNEDQVTHGAAPYGLAAYLTSAHFIEATAENWESEFLQMALYVLLTVFLFQRGSAESKNPDKPGEVDEEPTGAEVKADAPWPVRRGGWALKIYRWSLSLSFLMLFLLAFIAHGISGAHLSNIDRGRHGQGPQSIVEFMTESRFWFEAMQNWQSEFLAVLSIVVLSIYLRQKGSPESKPVAMAHRETPSD